MTGIILVLNAGSSSIKFSLFHANLSISKSDMLCKGHFSGIGNAPHCLITYANGSIVLEKKLAIACSYTDIFNMLFQWINDFFPEKKLMAVGHRIVHGAMRYTEPAKIDQAMINQLRRFISLAPLHQPHHIAAIEILQKYHPLLPQAACFDTAFHHTQSAIVTRFALPRILSDEGVRRYGFHGLSYEYIAQVLPDILGKEGANANVIVAHLGAGASLCAIKNGKSVATTTGFTALDGIPMSRRCGNLDPGVILYLMQEKGMSVDEVAALLYQQSGLLGMSGISDDMPTLLASDDPHAKEAIDVFVYRIGRELGSLVAALGGLDVLVFTAGIGEHSPEIRRRICDTAAWLGITINNVSNVNGEPRLSFPDSKITVLVIPTNEDLMIAQHTQRVLSTG